MDNSTFLALFGGLTILYAAAWMALEKLIPDASGPSRGSGMLSCAFSLSLGSD